MPTSVLILTTILSLPLTGITQNSANTKPVSLLLPRETATGYLLYFNFYKQRFNEFYTCLRKTSWGKCILDLAPDSSHPYQPDDRYVTSVRNDHQLKLSSHLDYFECKFDQSKTQIFCERFTASCNSTSFVSFRFCTSSWCDTGCARILSNRKEKLLHSNTDKIQGCNVTCDQSTTSITHTASSALSVQFTLTAAATTTADSTNQATHELIQDKAEDNKVPVIIGAVCGAAVVIIVTVVGVLLWRRKWLSHNKQEKSQNNPVSQTLTSINGLDPRDSEHSPDVQKKNHGLPETSTDTAVSRDSETKNRNMMDPGCGYYDIKLGYINVLHNGHSEQSASMKLCNEQKEDPDYETAEIIDPYNTNKISSCVEGDYSENAETTTAYDDYSVAHNDNNLDVIDVASQLKNVYARLRENVKNIQNPYNSFSEMKQNPHTRHPLYDTPKMKETINENIDPCVEIVNISPTPENSQIVRGQTHENTTSENMPEYSVVMEKKK